MFNFKIMAVAKKNKRNNRDQKLIGISRQKKEWKVFDKRIKEFGPRNTFSKYLRKKTESLANDYKENPDYVLASLIDNKTKRRMYALSPEVYKVYKEISKKSLVPITTIIDRLIVSPLLIEK